MNKPNRDDFQEGDKGWNQYFDSCREYENYLSKQAQKERGPTYNLRQKLEELMQNQDWIKAVKFAESVKFSDKDKADLQSIIQKIIKENGGYQSQFFYDYGRELLSKTLKSPDKPYQYSKVEKTQPAPKQSLIWPVIGLVLGIVTVAYSLSLAYQYLAQIAVLAFIAFIVMILLDVAKNSP